MATSKKDKQEDKKKVEVNDEFSLDDALESLTMPNMFKAGLRYYVESNNLKVTSIKEFDKIVKDYSNLKMEAN